LWTTQLSVFNADITRFEISRKYDIIVSNPPFFKDSLKSSNEQKNIAKHCTSLPYSALASIVFDNLDEHGRFYILLPTKEFEVFEKIARENQLALMEKTNIRHDALSENFRIIGVFTNTAVQKSNTKSLTIKDSNKEYTPEIIELLKDYYLFL
jgi:tRNA1Val (adenine37-N6)-methyltransferase